MILDGGLAVPPTLAEKCNVVTEVKQYGLSCLTSIQKFQESCVFKTPLAAHSPQIKALKEELQSKFKAHKCSSVQEIMKFVSNEIENLS